MFKTISFMVAAMLLLAISGCKTEYTYAPPTTAKGKACVAKCEAQLQSCTSSMEQRAEAKFQECDKQASVRYEACLQYSEHRKKCFKEVCIKDGTEPCNVTYRACYQNCGGTVGILK